MYMESPRGSHSWTEVSLKSRENSRNNGFCWKIKSAKETSEIILNLVNLHPTYHKINKGMPKYEYQGNVHNVLLTTQCIIQFKITEQKVRKVASMVKTY